MITNINFDDLTINSVQYGSHTIIETQGFAPEFGANYVSRPRSNGRTFVSSFSSGARRKIILEIRGDSRSDFVDKVESLYGKVDNSYEFNVVVEDMQGGIPTPLKSYIFDGYISRIERTGERSYQVDYGSFEITVECETHILKSSIQKSDFIVPTVAGFTFPFIFPIIFSGGGNTITITNNGTDIMYPEFVITGGGTNFDITSNDNTLANPIFRYTGSIASSNTVTLNALETDNLKVLDNFGNTQISNTNFNWEVLKVRAGQVITYTFDIGTGQDSNSKLTINYRDSYKGI